jgi:hypothetical protein
MPKFIDYHASLPKMPPEAIKDMTARVKAGKADQFGVQPLNVFMDKDGRAYCLTEAPTADAVVKSQQANGVHLDRHDVGEVTSLV